MGKGSWVVQGWGPVPGRVDRPGEAAEVDPLGAGTQLEGMQLAGCR